MGGGNVMMNGFGWVVSYIGRSWGVFFDLVMVKMKFDIFCFWILLSKLYMLKIDKCFVI